MAAQMLIRRIQNPNEAYADAIHFDPELIARESTRAVVCVGDGVGEAGPKRPARKAKGVLARA
jgi:hypothetical protein